MLSVGYAKIIVAVLLRLRIGSHNVPQDPRCITLPRITSLNDIPIPEVEGHHAVGRYHMQHKNPHFHTKEMLIRRAAPMTNTGSCLAAYQLRGFI